MTFVFEITFLCVKLKGVTRSQNPYFLIYFGAIVQLKLFSQYSVRLIAVVAGLVLNMAFLFASFGSQLHQVN